MKMATFSFCRFAIKCLEYTTDAKEHFQRDVQSRQF